MKRFSWLFLLSILLVGCGESLPSFMRPTYPATKYFTGDLLPLAQLIEDDDPTTLATRLTYAPDYVRREVGREGMTLVVYAMMNRRKDCLRVLLTHGWNPNQNTRLSKDELQMQPVGLAAGGEDSELLTLLFDHGGDPNSRFNDKPALFAAINQDRYDHMRLLLDRGANINATDGDGDTVMQVLAYTNQFEQIAYLIKRGADVHILTNTELRWPSLCRIIILPQKVKLTSSSAW
jgi:ankyrin repeat protein